jgi:hypothetical protein
MAAQDDTLNDDDVLSVRFGVVISKIADRRYCCCSSRTHVPADADASASRSSASVETETFFKKVADVTAVWTSPTPSKRCHGGATSDVHASGRRTCMNRDGELSEL